MRNEFGFHGLTFLCNAGDDLTGMPIGLQVMCPTHQEETVLGLAEAISEALGAGK